MFIKLTEVKTRQGNYGVPIVVSEVPIYLNMDRVGIIRPFTQQWEEREVVAINPEFGTPKEITTTTKSLTVTLVEIDGRQLQVKESIDFITTSMRFKEEE